MKYYTILVGIILILSACGTKTINSVSLTPQVTDALTHKTKLTKAYFSWGNGHFEWEDGLSAKLIKKPVMYYDSMIPETRLVSYGATITFNNGLIGELYARSGVISYLFNGKFIRYPYDGADSELQKKYYSIIGTIAGPPTERLKPMKLYKSSDEIP